MVQTYLLNFNNKPLIYVFDENGVPSYTHADKDGLADFFNAVFTKKSKLCRSIGAQVDYMSLGFNAMKEMYTICAQTGSDNILNYLKKLRDEYKDIGLTLKRRDGLVESMYNSEMRKTPEIIIEELKKSGMCR